MVVNKKVTGKAIQMPVGISIGLAVSIVITMIGAVIVANLLISEKIGESAIGYGAIVILLLASAVGSWIGAMLTKHRWIIVCIGVGGSYYLTLLAITALFFGGQYQGMGVTALAILGGSGAVGLLGLNKEIRPRNRAKKYRFR